MSHMECPYDQTLQEDLECIAALPIAWNMLDHATVLITGATGLIGSFLVRAFLAANRIRGYQIQLLAMVRSGEKAQKMFGDLLRRQDIEILIGDVTKSICTNREVDYIIHTAGVTASKEIVTHPVGAIEVAVKGTKNVLELARKKRCKSVIYLSSMEVYGTLSAADGHRTMEGELGYIDLSSVRSCYPESKRLCENMCICYAAQYGVPVKIARLAQTFGAGAPLNDSRVFAQFARAAMEGKDIVLHTRGESNGNYCYTADSVAGLLTILLYGKDAETYNVVSEDATTTIAQMARMISEKITAGKSEVIFDIPDDAQIYGYAADVKLRLSGRKLQGLGWQPFIAPELETMFRRLIASFEAQKA